MPYRRDDEPAGYYAFLGSQIRTSREKRGLTQEDLCVALSPPVSRSALSRWESGERRAPASRLAEIAALLGCPPREWLRRDVEETDLDREMEAAFREILYSSEATRRALLSVLRWEG